MKLEKIIRIITFNKCYTYQIQEDKMDGACNTPGIVEKCIQILIGKTEQIRSLGR